MDEHRIQLGTIHLDIASGPSDVPLDAPWQGLSADYLRSIDISESSSKIVAALTTLLADGGIAFQAESRRDDAGLIVRVSISPSDAPGSTWRRQPAKVQKARAGALKLLFEALQAGWDGPGPWVMGRTAEDEMKMSDLYARLPSPTGPGFQLDGPKGFTRAEKEVRMCLNGYWEPDGIQTAMYRYQFRSVSRMLQMETLPGRMVDPHYIPLAEAGRPESTYYLDTREWDVQRHPGWYDLPRGGILCEQMGVGKTLMCLALIVASLRTPTRPPVDSVGASPAMSEESLGTWPFAAHDHARAQLNISRSGRGIPSLSALCLDKLRRTDTLLKPTLLNLDPDNAMDPLVKAEEEYIPPMVAAESRRPMFYYAYPHEPVMPRGVKTQRRSLPTKMWLANTTLVVVPQILLEQWKAEIEKHVQAGMLRMLEISAKEDVPRVQVMLQYDLILIDVAHEGHVAGSVTSNAMRLAIALSVERRWIVSGTPTKHLQQGGESEAASSISPHEATPIVAKHLAWSKRDVDDAMRIGVMIGGFLAAEPFRAEDTFNEKVTKLLRGKQGPKFGAVRRLRYLMGVTMVKHAPHIIDAEASLPPSTVSVKMLPFHPMQRVTYNVLAALIASNVYTSNFEDPDYFLHPRNASAFHQVIRNLHLACFWYSAHEMGAQECLDRTKKHLATNTTLVPTGRAVLEEAVQHLERALATPGWEEWMRHGVSIAFEAAHLPSSVKAAWSDSAEQRPDLVDSHSLALLRDLNTPGKLVNELEVEGRTARTIKWEGLRQEESQGKSKGSGNKRKREDHEGDVVADEIQVVGEAGAGSARLSSRNVGASSGSTKTAAKRPIAAGTFTTAPKSPQKAKKARTGTKQSDDSLEARLNEAAKNAAAMSAMNPAERPATPPKLEGPRPLPATLSTRSRSAKVNFVLRAVQSAAKDDKFVIFGDVFELGHMREALDLIDVMTCFAGSSVSGAKRAEAVKEFERPEMKVFLLELKVGARGLNLVTANRMIFLSPVWNLDVQAQAIKRVHRIGQTKPTTVEILVTQGTFEEDIAERSSTSRSEQEEQRYSRAMIENPSFVYTEDEGEWSFDIRFAPIEEAPPEVVPAVASPSQSGSSPDLMLVTPGTPVSAQTPFGVGQPESPIWRAREAPQVKVEGFAEGKGDRAPGSAIWTPLTAMEHENGEEPLRKKKKARVAFA